MNEQINESLTPIPFSEDDTGAEVDKLNICSNV